MIPILRKNLSSLFPNYASYRRNSCTLSLRLFTTSKKRALVASPAILHLLLHKHQFSPEVASKVASVLNRVEDPKKSDSVLSFLKESGFSNAQLQRMLKNRPHYLLVSIEDTIKPKLRVFQNLGFRSDDIAKIFSSNYLMELNFNTRVIPSLSILKGLLMTDDAVAKLLRRSGWFLNRDLKRTFVPNIEFLKSCGVPMERIIRLLYNSPLCLLLKPEIIRTSVQRAEEMGVNRSSNMFIYALQACSVSGNAWELKLQAFRNCGFSESDIMAMFRKAPQLFSRSVENLTRVKDVLLATGKYSMSCIVNNPVALSCSVEKRFTPRFQILEILESKNLIENWPSLGAIFRMSDDYFFEKFVSPYLSEVGEVYIAKSTAMAKRASEHKAFWKKWN